MTIFQRVTHPRSISGRFDDCGEFTLWIFPGSARSFGLERCCSWSREQQWSERVPWGVRHARSWVNGLVASI
jgi:hypothetical protein